MSRTELVVTVDQVEAGVRIAVSGDLDLASVDRLRSILERQRGSGNGVVLDLSGLEFIDSVGLQLFLSAQADARRDGWSLAFAPEVGPAVGRLLDLTGTRPVLDWA